MVDKQEKPQRDQLPDKIVQRLNECVMKHTDRKLQREVATYLSIYVTKGKPAVAGTDEEKESSLSLEEWLNVIDEAVSLGVKWLIVCIEEPISECDIVFAICDWAQLVHDINICIYPYGQHISADEIAQLSALNHNSLYLCVGRAVYQTLREISDHTINIIVVDDDDMKHSLPCTVPSSIVCLSAKGRMYPCGFVLGNEQFCLGDVLEQQLVHIVADPSLPRTIPKGTPCAEHACLACPPKLVRLILKAATNN